MHFPFPSDEETTEQVHIQRLATSYKIQQGKQPIKNLSCKNNFGEIDEHVNHEFTGLKHWLSCFEKPQPSQKSLQDPLLKSDPKLQWCKRLYILHVLG